MKETYNISSELYRSLQDEVNDLLYQISANMKVPVCYLRAWHVWAYVTKVRPVSYEKLNTILFPTLVNQVEGMTTAVENRLIICLAPSAYKERVHFTLMHEIAHALFDYEMDSSNKVVKKKKTGIEEIRADVAASLFLVNDVALEIALIEGKRFDEICDEHKMSKNALHCRLINYVEHDHKKDKAEAKTIVNGYRYNRSTRLRGLAVGTKVVEIISQIA